jgi:hypothetical protein
VVAGETTHLVLLTPTDVKVPAQADHAQGQGRERGQAGAQPVAASPREYDMKHFEVGVLQKSGQLGIIFLGEGEAAGPPPPGTWRVLDTTGWEAEVRAVLDRAIERGPEALLASMGLSQGAGARARMGASRHRISFPVAQPAALAAGQVFPGGVLSARLRIELNGVKKTATLSVNFKNPNAPPSKRKNETANATDADAAGTSAAAAAAAAAAELKEVRLALKDVKTRDHLGNMMEVGVGDSGLLGLRTVPAPEGGAPGVVRWRRCEGLEGGDLVEALVEALKTSVAA